ncbi:hypothetical protein, variant [Phytophthora nicotianae P10297]|uniref:t-SNARE coiled-coil homology domain-containing protein n=1 Tax=Phytophthora nicotianae P10297 TaxID=1317064 RepID=W2Y4L2_PHYNI|nr:hypothetical protein, variant [Phytophthora nicotianae P10297]
MMQTATRTWEELRSSARAAEHTLEDKIAAYTAVSRAQTRSSSAVYDEENPPEETADERELAVDIENALASLSDTIDEMNVVVNKTSVKTQDAMLQRYREVYFDFNTEFRRSMVRLVNMRAGRLEFFCMALLTAFRVHQFTCVYCTERLAGEAGCTKAFWQQVRAALGAMEWRSIAAFFSLAGL